MRHYTIRIMTAVKQPWFLFTLIFALIYQLSSGAELSDTLRINGKDAEEIFLKNNLTLLAERLNINQAEAMILQAKVWPNPNLSIEEINFNRNETSEKIPPLIGNFGRNQQFTVQLEQLILTAKKRKKNIRLETTNKILAENSFMDILLALKAEFRSELAELIYQQRLKDDLSLQNNIIVKLLDAQSAQFKLGNISRADFLRVKALQISVNSELNEVNTQINEKQTKLKTWMAISSSTHIVILDGPDNVEIERLQSLSVQKLLEDADRNNTQIKLANNSKDISIDKLGIEQAKKTPDITLNLSYDRAGSTMFNFFGAGIAMDIPLFDRNKGNIKHAVLEVQKDELKLREKKLAINNQIVEHFQNLQQAIHLYNQIDKDYLGELKQIQAAVADNFIKKNLSLLAFLDLFNSFKESKQLYYQSLKDIKMKENELNYLAGIEL